MKVRGRDWIRYEENKRKSLTRRKGRRKDKERNRGGNVDSTQLTFDLMTITSRLLIDTGI
jgi:hypothetical protein